jgi:hypothetical protein
LVSIYADITDIPPSIIYQAMTGNLQTLWVQDLDIPRHKAYFASSPTGWTNDDLGYEWLTKVFNRETKAKARNNRDYRLLIVDGHGSHMNLKWLTWCKDNRVLVCVDPPYSTHRLQPLDVSLFALLSIYYSQQLDKFATDLLGLSRITKRDFFRLF